MDAQSWNDRYSGTELVWTAKANRFVVEELADLPPGRALDLAAGEGRNAVWLAEQGWEVTAVDFAEAAVAKGKELMTARNVQVAWQVADLIEFEPPAGSYDLVLLCYLHLPWPDMQQALATASRALASGGTLLVIGHDASNIEQGHGGPQIPEILYDAQQVADALSQLRVNKAAAVKRPVDTEQGQRVAIDCLVRAERPA